MRILVGAPVERHAEACTTVAVSVTGDIISGGDDFALRRWDQNGEALGQVKQFDSCVTFVVWPPGSGRRGKGAAGAGPVSDAGRDTCLVACADGSFYFVNITTSRVERTVDAHNGAITAIVYSADGSSIVSAGEDGNVKVWSQAGIPRTTLVSAGVCVYTLCWGTSSAELGGDCVLYTIGSDVIIKPLNPSVKKQLKWKAHNGVVLCCDWSRMSNLIVTGGEDGVYKVWDPYGRNIYTSAAAEHPCTSVRFAADGEVFAVGGFMSVRVCDKTGWSHSYERMTEGSVLSLQWTADGTQIVTGCGSGAVCTAQLVDRKLHWESFVVSLVDSRKLQVQNVVDNTTSELEHRDKIIKLALSHGYLVVCTTTQCICYPVLRLGSPVLFDLRDAVVTLILSEKHFLIADCAQGVQLYSYEGRQICVARLQASLRPEIISSEILAVSKDCVGIRSPADPKRILFFEAASGRPMEDATVTHHIDIVYLALSQHGALADRRVAFIDRNNDLHLGSVQQKLPVQKLSAMTTSIMWHDQYETLAAISDGHLVTWFFPSIIYTDRDLLSKTKMTRDDVAFEFSRNDRIQDFHGARLNIRRGVDGALLMFGISPFPAMIFDLVARRDWASAMRLARFLQEDLLWCLLIALAVKHGELNVAEVGYGALGELDKVRYIHDIKDIPSPEGRLAEITLFQRRTAEAEKILLQAGLAYRCIDMHTRLFNWERALELAQQQKIHVDTVLWRRQQYLGLTGRSETLPKLKATAEGMKLDEKAIEERVAQEHVKESQRPNAKPYQ